MEYYNNRKSLIKHIDHTLLEEKLHIDKLISFYEDYLSNIENNNTPASFCVYPRDLHRLRAYSFGLTNPCVVINFPYATDSEEQLIFQLNYFYVINLTQKFLNLCLFIKKCLKNIILKQ